MVTIQVNRLSGKQSRVFYHVYLTTHAVVNNFQVMWPHVWIPHSTSLPLCTSLQLKALCSSSDGDLKTSVTSGVGVRCIYYQFCVCHIRFSVSLSVNALRADTCISCSLHGRLYGRDLASYVTDKGHIISAQAFSSEF